MPNGLMGWAQKPCILMKYKTFYDIYFLLKGIIKGSLQEKRVFEAGSSQKKQIEISPSNEYFAFPC